MYVDIPEKSDHSITSILYQLNQEMKSIWLENAPKFMRPLTVSKIFDINILFDLVSQYFLSTKKSEGRGLAQVRSQFRSNTHLFIFIFIHSFIHSVNHNPYKYLLGTHFTITSLLGSKPSKQGRKDVPFKKLTVF